MYKSYGVVTTSRGQIDLRSKNLLAEIRHIRLGVLYGII